LSFTTEECNGVMLLTRGEHRYRDCKIVYMIQNKKTNEIKDMEYDEYINYK
jgi:hypothetical protein